MPDIFAFHKRTNGVSQSEPPSNEVLPRAQRRSFTTDYKLRVLDEADACREPGQIGALLRREGLYSSHLSNWRQQRAQGQLQGLSPKRRGRKPSPVDEAARELERLRREKAQLERRLLQAETIIEVQKNRRGALTLPV